MANMYAFVFLGTAVGAFLLVPFVRLVARTIGTIDYPDGERKKHAQPTPLLGGWSIFLSLSVATFTVDQATSVFEALPEKYLWGIFFAGLLLMIGGTFDDKWNLSAKWQWVFPFAAALVIIASGIGINFITNPFGGVIRLDQWEVSIFQVGNISYQLTVWADLFTIVWLLGMTYTTKFLDGLDGLVSGVGVVASFILFGISLLPEVSQSYTAVLAVSFAGACLGFLVWNWHPAKIFLGEGGSLLIGFFLGTLSIISGGKIATALLVMGVPIMDVAWVIGRRIFFERRSAFRADRKHLHFRLLDAGFTAPQAVGIFLGISSVFGSLAIVLRGKDKLLLLTGVVAVMFILAGIVVRRYNATRKQS